MKQSIGVLMLSVIAAEAITKGQLVTLDGKVAVAAKDAHGVAGYDAAIGEILPVTVVGTAVVKAGAALTIGKRVQVGTTGQAVTHSTGVPVGIALETVASGDYVEILISSAGIAGAAV